MTMHYIDARKLADDKSALARASLEEINAACDALQVLQRSYSWPIAQDDARWTRLLAAKHQAIAKTRASDMTGLSNVIRFLEGFAGGGSEKLIVAAKKADELLHKNLDAWEDEEDSVQEEHEDMITELRTFLGRE